jgi:hypothetical protein
VINKTLETIYKAKPTWIAQIHHSFLSDEMKERYIDVVESRFERLPI